MANPHPYETFWAATDTRARNYVKVRDAIMKHLETCEWEESECPTSEELKELIDADLIRTKGNPILVFIGVRHPTTNGFSLTLKLGNGPERTIMYITRYPRS